MKIIYFFLFLIDTAILLTLTYFYLKMRDHGLSVAGSVEFIAAGLTCTVALMYMVVKFINGHSS